MALLFTIDHLDLVVSLLENYTKPSWLKEVTVAIGACIAAKVALRATYVGLLADGKI